MNTCSYIFDRSSACLCTSLCHCVYRFLGSYGQTTEQVSQEVRYLQVGHLQHLYNTIFGSLQSEQINGAYCSNDVDCQIWHSEKEGVGENNLNGVNKGITALYCSLV